MIILLRPTAERMMVALGTHDPHAQKYLREGRRHRPRLGNHLVEVTLRRVAQRTLGSDQFVDHRIKGHVVGQSATDPLVILVGTLVPQRLPIDPQQAAYWQEKASEQTGPEATVAFIEAFEQRETEVRVKFGARTYIPIEDAEAWRDDLLRAQADEAMK